MYKLRENLNSKNFGKFMHISIASNKDGLGVKLFSLTKFEFSQKYNKSKKFQKISPEEEYTEENKVDAPSPTLEPIDLDTFNKYSYEVLRDLYIKAEGSLQNNTYSFNNFVNSNFFGQNPLYLASKSVPVKYLYSNIELSGVALLTLISFLNWYSIIFPSMYLFNYLLPVNLFAISRYYWKIRFLDTFIYQVCLIDEQNVKLTYINGEIEILTIKNIYLTNKMRDNLVLHDPDKPQPNKNIVPLEVRVNGKKDAFIILQSNSKFNNFVELELLIAVLHKNTFKIRFS